MRRTSCSSSCGEVGEELDVIAIAGLSEVGVGNAKTFFRLLKE